MLVTHDHDEAFTVADRMAVMLSGQVVQEGRTSEVWRAPVSVEVARFIGFETVLTGSAAEKVAGRTRAGGPIPGAGEVLALRRSALRVDDEGVLTGTVRRAVAVSDAVHLTVDVDGVGECAVLAVIPEVGVGDRVELALDPVGACWIPA